MRNLIALLGVSGKMVVWQIEVLSLELERIATFDAGCTRIQPSQTGALFRARNLSRAIEYPCEHRFCQFAGVGILQRWMVTREQISSVWQCILRSMGEYHPPAPVNLSRAKKMLHKSIEGNFSQAHHHPQIFKRRYLLIEIGRAVRNFLWRRLVIRWCAPHHRRDLQILKPHTVIARYGVRLGREARVIEHRIQEVS